MHVSNIQLQNVSEDILSSLTSVINSRLRKCNMKSLKFMAGGIAAGTALGILLQYFLQPLFIKSIYIRDVSGRNRTECIVKMNVSVTDFGKDCCFDTTGRKSRPKQSHRLYPIHFIALKSTRLDKTRKHWRKDNAVFLYLPQACWHHSAIAVKAERQTNKQSLVTVKREAHSDPSDNPIANQESYSRTEEHRKHTGKIKYRNRTGVNMIATSSIDFGNIPREIDKSSRRVVVVVSYQKGRRSGSDCSTMPSEYLNKIERQYSKSTEGFCVQTFSNQEELSWRRNVWNLDIVQLEEGCGRMQNRLLTFSDSSQACARYRDNVDQIQGEIYSYYLSQLLGITHIPPSTLARVRRSDPQWSRVQGHLADSRWTDGKVIVLTKWVNDLKPVYIPKEIREPAAGLSTDKNKSDSEICELLQWSDLIVFDYLTANLDRMVNNMHNRKWSRNMMEKPVHNLLRSGASGNLIFLDNESGLFHGYRSIDKYFNYHESLLRSLCTFRKTTVSRIEQLYKNGNIETELHSLFMQQEQLHHILPWIPDYILNTLQTRLARLHHHINNCAPIIS